MSNFPGMACIEHEQYWSAYTIHKRKLDECTCHHDAGDASGVHDSRFMASFWLHVQFTGCGEETLKR